MAENGLNGRRLVAYVLVGVALAVLGGSQAAVHAFAETSNGTWWLPVAEQQPAFHGRWLSSTTARWFLDGRVGGEAAGPIGQWTALWLLGVYASYLLLWGEHALLFMLGTAAAIAWSYNEVLAGEITPWDMPSLLLWIFGAHLLANERYRRLAILAVAGVVVKETAVLLALALLWEQARPLRERLQRFALTCTAALAVKIVMTGLGGTWALGGGTVRRNDTGQPNLSSNFDAIISNWPGHLIFTAAGLLFAFLVVAPKREPSFWIGALFLGAQLLFGLVHEHRIFLEMVPIALVVLASNERPLSNGDPRAPTLPGEDGVARRSVPSRRLRNTSS